MKKIELKLVVVPQSRRGSQARLSSVSIERGRSGGWLVVCVWPRRAEATRHETKRDAFQVSRNSVAVGYDRSNSRPTTGDAISKLISIFYLHAPASSRQFYTSAIFRGVALSEVLPSLSVLSSLEHLASVNETHFGSFSRKQKFTAAREIGKCSSRCRFR